MKYLLIFFLLFQFTYSIEKFDTTEESIFDKQAKIQAIIDEQIPQDGENNEASTEDNTYSNEILINDDVEFNSDSVVVEMEPSTDYLFEKAYPDKYFDNIKKSRSLYASYERVPKILFKNQRFEIVLNVIVTTDEFEKIETRFLNSENIKVLNPTKQWEYGNKNKFLNKYYFKVESNSFIIPEFQILIYKEGKVFETVTLPSKIIQYRDIATQDESFSNVIADKLEVKSHISKQYTNKQLLTILEIDAVEGNLEDFKLKNVSEQGISSINGEYPNQTAIYYAVLPIYTKKIVFDYYNTKSNRLVQIVSRVKLTNELVSTQTDLNPNKSNILFYKKIVSGFFVLLFFMIYVFKRKFIYIFLGLVCLIIFILYNMPNKELAIKKGTNIYILPTVNSTVFYTTDKNLHVEILSEREGFTKILIENDNKKETIGWIKERDVVKN